MIGLGIRYLLVGGLVYSLSGCGSSPVAPAPVVDRSGGSVKATGSTGSTGSQTSSATPAPSASNDNVNKPGYYTIKPGDTLIRIGLETGQSYKDIAKWNNLDNPNHLEVGQVIRIVAPVGPVAAMPMPTPVATGGTATGSATTETKPVSSSTVSTSTLPAAGTGKPSGTTTLPPVTAAAGTAASVPSPVVTPTPAAAAADTAAGDSPAWLWPSKGTVLATFDDNKNKGVDIAGKLGDPVLAAGDGKVVYAGNGLRTYGNLIIIKHDNTYLTAYAHNQTLLVKEDQLVKRGQKIATMGDSDTDRVKLHFELRKQGKPVDPQKYLPAR